MGATRSIAKNTILLTVGLYSGRVLALFLRKKMTPILGPEGIGLWAAAISITGILQVVVNFGLGTLLTREVTKAPLMTLRLFWTTLKIRWLLACGCFLFLLGFVSVSGYPELDRAVILVMALAIFIEGTSMACDGVLQAHEKVQYQSIGQIASAILYFALGWVWLDAGYGIMGVVWANLVSRVARLAIMAPLMFLNTGPWQWRPHGADHPVSLKWMMKLGLPMFLATTFGIIYSQVDSVMLKSMVDNTANGIYSQGRQAFLNLSMLPSMFGFALFPAMQRAGQESPGDARRIGERALRYILAAMLPLTLFLTFTATPIIFWFGQGESFIDSVAVMQIVVWGLPLTAAATVFNRLLITAEKEKLFITIGLVPMLLNVGLNWMFIPRYTYFGASLATLVSLTVSVVLHIYFLRGTDFLPRLRGALLGPVAATALAWGLTVGLVKLLWPGWSVSLTHLPLAHGWTPFLVTVAVMVVLYPAALFLLRVLSLEDVRLLKNPR